MSVFLARNVRACVCVCVCVQLTVLIAYVVVRKNQGYSASMLANAPLDSPLIYQASRRYEAWRFLTYLFIHHGSVDIYMLSAAAEALKKWDSGRAMRGRDLGRGRASYPDMGSGKF